MLKTSARHLAVVTGLALTFLASRAQAVGAPIKLNAGLTAEILTLGRDDSKNLLTISLRISNTGPGPVYLLLVYDPPPIAVSNTGGHFILYRFGGLAQCNTNSLPACVGLPPAGVTGTTVPFASWTAIDAGASIIANFVMLGNNRGPLVSFSATVAYRSAASQLQENVLSDDQRREQVHSMTISFPPLPVQDGG